MEPTEGMPGQAAELRQLAQEWNEKLRAAGAGSAELALGLVIRLGFLPALGIVFLLFLFQIVDVIPAFVLMVIVSLVLLGISMLVSERARWNAMRQVYHSHVAAEILQHMHAHQLNKEQLVTLVQPVLPASSPLANFLSSAVDNLSEPIPENGNQEIE